MWLTLKRKERLGLCALSFASESNAKLRVHEPSFTLVIHIKPWMSSILYDYYTSEAYFNITYL